MADIVKKDVVLLVFDIRNREACVRADLVDSKRLLFFMYFEICDKVYLGSHNWWDLPLEDKFGREKLQLLGGFEIRLYLTKAQCGKNPEAAPPPSLLLICLAEEYRLRLGEYGTIGDRAVDGVLLRPAYKSSKLQEDERGRLRCLKRSTPHAAASLPLTPNSVTQTRKITSITNSMISTSS
jgi:hypothetical protein